MTENWIGLVVDQTESPLQFVVVVHPVALSSGGPKVSGPRLLATGAYCSVGSR